MRLYVSLLPHYPAPEIKMASSSTPEIKMASSGKRRKTSDMRSQFGDAWSRAQTTFDDVVAQLERSQEENGKVTAELAALKVQHRHLQEVNSDVTAELAALKAQHRQLQQKHEADGVLIDNKTHRKLKEPCGSAGRLGGALLRTPEYSAFFEP